MTARPILVRRPRTFVVLVTVALVVLLGAAGAAIVVSGAPLSTPVPVVFLPVAVTIALWATLTKRWRLLGFRALSTRLSVSVVAVLPVAAVLILAALSTGGPAQLSVGSWLSIAGLVLLVAFVEEVLFRSVFLAVLRPGGTVQAVALSTLAFTLGHSVNVLSGQNLDATIRQLCFAFAFGLAASVIYLGTASIWPTLILHVLFNFVQLTGMHQTPAVVDWIMTAILLLGAGWLALRTRSASEAGVRARPVAA